MIAAAAVPLGQLGSSCRSPGQREIGRRGEGERGVGVGERGGKGGERVEEKITRMILLTSQMHFYL